MGWLDKLLADLDATAATPAAPVVAKPRQRKTEIKSVWFQTRQPVDADDPGECEPGYYSVADGVVIMRDESGNPTGKEYRLGPDDDAQQVAGRIARKAWVEARGLSNFNRPLEYQKGSFA